MQASYLGKQLVVDFYDCCPGKLNNLDELRSAMLAAANESAATIVTNVFHQFSPYGLSGVVVIAESHFCIHTWPEYRIASLDIFTCSGHMSPELGIEFLRKHLQAQRVDIRELPRGRLPQRRAEAHTG